MRVYALTDIGSVRAVNEDSYFAPSSGEPFCCVADGMGGAQAGEVASSMVSTYSRSI
jgi:protein phosphatase